MFSNGRKKLYVDVGTIEQMNEAANGGGEDSDEAKKIMKDISVWQQAGSLVVLNGDGDSIYRADNIISELKKGSTHRWCVITEDDILARELYAIGNANYIAVRPYSNQNFKIFTGEHVEEIPVKTASIKEADDIFEERFEDTGGSGFQAPDPIALRSQKVFVGDPERRRELRLGREISSGGEGIVNFVEDMPDYCVKRYKEGKWTEERVRKIIEMTKERPALSLPKGICWPEKPVWDMWGESVLGFLMPLAYHENGVCSLRQILLDLASGKLEWTRIHLFQLCMKINSKFKKLHENEILMGDINMENILVGNYEKMPEDMEIYLIDTDSYQFKDFVCPVGTEEYTSKRIYKKYKKVDYSSFKREPEDEHFAMAVLYFYILFIMESPYATGEGVSVRQSIEGNKFRFDISRQENRNYIWKNLSETLQNLFKEVFVKNREIDENRWEREFRNMIALIEEKRLSNELWPKSAIEGPEDRWRKIKCHYCGKEFWIAKNELQYDDDWCPDCKIRRNLSRKKIYRIRCCKCKKLWTINEWDACQNKIDTDHALCPDCNPSFKYSNRSRYQAKDEKEREEKVEMAISYAFKYFKRREARQ